jgi:organic hydroperoxide reductase OsmC/OhrA
MTSIAVTEFETHLQWQGERRATLSTEHAPSLPLGGMVAGHPLEDRWCPETLLVGALEGRILQIFLERARAERLEPLFYQSTATGRRVENPGGQPHFTDFIVRPHVAVRSEQDAERARRIFEELPCRCFPSSMMQLAPRIEPVVEVWGDSPHASGRKAPAARGPDISA